MTHSVTYADSRTRISPSGDVDGDPRILGDITRARAEAKKIQSKTAPSGSIIATDMLKSAKKRLALQQVFKAK